VERERIVGGLNGFACALGERAQTEFVDSLGPAVLLAQVPEETSLREALFGIWASLRGHLRFRACSIDRLPDIIETGCDVRPSTSPMYAATGVNAEKVLEYGGWPKVIQIIDGECTDRTYREVPASLPQPELEELAKTFPFRSPSADGASLWLTRLREDDRRIATSYETEWAVWIPGDPHQALLGIIILWRDADELDLARSALEDCARAARARERRKSGRAHVIREGHDDGSFDVEFWSSLPPETRFEAAWACVLDLAAMKGIDEAELRLQRSAVRVQRR
jgi:hypothetical protein